MKTKLLAILLLLVCLASWQDMRADNVVKISDSSGSPGLEVDVSVSLANTDVVSAMQLSIPLNDNIQLVENSIQLASRVSGHSATIGVKDGNINIFVYSSTMAEFSGNSGEVVNFKVKLGSTPTTVTLSSAKLILTDASGTSLSGSVNNGSVTIKTAKAEYSSKTIDFGRVPIKDTYTQNLTINNVGNESLEVTDLIFSASEFSCAETLPFTIAASSSKTIALKYAPTVRGSMSKELKVMCNSSLKLNTITLTANPYAVNELHVENAVGYSDEETTIHLRVNNMDALNGFQFEFDLPDQLKYVDGSFALSDRSNGHQLLATLTGTKLAAICYSLSNKTFTGEDGDIATFKVRIDGRNSTSLEASKAILTANIDGEDINVCSDKYAGNVSIYSPRLYANTSVSFGTEAVTANPTRTYYIRNYGNAPLTISKILLSNDDYQLNGLTLPATITASGYATVTISYKNKTVGDHPALMQIYSNDPDNRLQNVTLAGTLYSPNFINLSTGSITTETSADIAVTLSNHQKISGMQFDITYSSDVYTFDSENVKLLSAMSGFTVTVRPLSNGKARVFIYSLSDNVVETDTAKIMMLSLQPIKEKITTGQYSVSLSNLILGNENLQNVESSASASVSFTVEEPLYTPGDVNNDGQVSIADVAAVVSYLNGKTPDKFSETAADADKSGTIDINDVLTIVDIINSQIVH